MVVEKLVFYRGNQLFKKRFSLSQEDQNGVIQPFVITLLTNPTIRWWFKDDTEKIFIDWTPPASGASNEIALFTVLTNFFKRKAIYDSQIEVFDSTGFLIHSEEIFQVEILEPAGVHTDPTT